MERQASTFQAKCCFWFNSSALGKAACNSWPLFLFFFQVGFFPGDCVELISNNVPEALLNSVPKPGTDVTFDGAGKQRGIFFGVCSVCNTSLLHPTLSSVLMILRAYHGAYGCCFVGRENEGGQRQFSCKSGRG